MPPGEASKGLNACVLAAANACLNGWRAGGPKGSCSAAGPKGPTINLAGVGPRPSSPSVINTHTRHELLAVPLIEQYRDALLRWTGARAFVHMRTHAACVRLCADSGGVRRREPVDFAAVHVV